MFGHISRSTNRIKLSIASRCVTICPVSMVHRRSAYGASRTKWTVNAGEILQRLAGVKVQHGRKQEGPRCRGPVNSIELGPRIGVQKVPLVAGRTTALAPGGAGQGCAAGASAVA